MTVMAWAIVAAAVLLLLALVLMLTGRGMRSRRGLGGGETLSLDKITLTSPRLGLTGRPDHLIRRGGMVWPEEWKSSKQVRPWHRAQLGVYFLLIKDQMSVQPPHGFIVSNRTRHQIDNTEKLRSWVLDMAAKIRQGREAADEPIIVHPKPGQCRACGVRKHCQQAIL
jgi:CRISPR-associated exonuclease Cas4